MRTLKSGRPYGPISPKKFGTGTQAAGQIAPILDRIPHTVYVDPFVGRGDVYRAKASVQTEILNDLDCKRTADARRAACKLHGTAKSEACQRITKQARVTCGRDWKASLRYDSPETLFFLDPPWEDVDKNVMPYAKNDSIPASEIVKRTRGLKGAVAIYYRDNAKSRKALCKKPFKCHIIRSHIFNNSFSHVLAVKQPSGSKRRAREALPKHITLHIE